MSLIEEALRRQQEDSGKAPDPEPLTKQPIGLRSPDAPASTPPPVPVETLTLRPDALPQPAPEPVPDLNRAAPVHPRPEETTRSRAWPGILIVVLIILLLAGSGTWIAVFAVRHWAKSPATSGETGGAEAAAASRAGASGGGESGNGARHEPEEYEIDESDPAISGVTIASASSGRAAIGSNTTGPKAAPVAVRKPPVRWPLLSLTGIVGRGKTGAAMIDGEIVAVGETITDVEIIAIEKQGVTLEYKGERKLLRVGHTVE